MRISCPEDDRRRTNEIWWMSGKRNMCRKLSMASRGRSDADLPRCCSGWMNWAPSAWRQLIFARRDDFELSFSCSTTRERRETYIVRCSTVWLLLVRREQWIADHQHDERVWETVSLHRLILRHWRMWFLWPMGYISLSTTYSTLLLHWQIPCNTCHDRSTSKDTSTLTNKTFNGSILLSVDDNRPRHPMDVRFGIHP